MNPHTQQQIEGLLRDLAELDKALAVAESDKRQADKTYNEVVSAINDTKETLEKLQS
jgi:hypothetical protein